MLEGRGLACSFGGRPVLHPTHVTVHDGEVLGVIGPSGAGKSTLGRVLVGLTSPTAGEVRVLGQRLWPSDRALRRRVPLVFQDPIEALDPRMTGAQVLAPFADARQRAGLLARLGLPPEALARRPFELSGGHRQRLVLARALAVEPVALVLDEPTSALDRPSARRLLEILADLLLPAGSTLRAAVLISHDLRAIERLATRVLVLHQGSTLEDGPTGEVLARPRHPLTRALIRASTSLRAGSR